MQCKIFIYFKFFQFNRLEFKNLISDNCKELGEKHNGFKLSDNHSSAFLDIDADCVTDLIISSTDHSTNEKYLEVWRGVIDTDKKKLTYCLTSNSVYKVPKELGQFTIADLNRDGMLDLIFSITEGSPRALIAYNQVILTYDWEADYCAKHSNVANSFPQVFLKFSTDVDQTNSNLNENSLKNEIIFLYNDKTQVFYDDSETDKLVSPVIRVGDVNSDSYPDITFVLQNEDKTRQAFVFFNCGYKQVKDATISSKFSEECNKNEEKMDLNKISSNAIYSSFFDLDENGQLDVLVISKVDNDTYNIKAYYNNFSYDAFFLKSQNSSSITNSAKEINKHYVLGVTYRYIATNLDGSRRMDVSNQLCQLSILAFNLPYSFIGIGRSNNYIENFHVITSSFTTTSNYNIFTPIIPNSQLLVSEERKETNVIAWSLNLIVNPTSKLFLLVIVIAITLVVLLAVIIILHSKEKREDQENESIFTQWFN